MCNSKGLCMILACPTITSPGGGIGVCKCVFYRQSQRSITKFKFVFLNNRQRDRQRGIQRDRQRDMQRDRQRQRETYRQRQKYTDRQTNRQTDRQTDIVKPIPLQDTPHPIQSLIPTHTHFHPHTFPPTHISTQTQFDLPVR